MGPGSSLAGCGVAAAARRGQLVFVAPMHTALPSFFFPLPAAVESAGTPLLVLYSGVWAACLGSWLPWVAGFVALVPRFQS